MALPRDQLIEQAFLAAAECEDPLERERVIRDKCSGDAGLIAEVQSLLGGHDAAAGGVLDRRSVAIPQSLAWSNTLGRGANGRAPDVGFAAGTRVGGYTLVKMIGAGGMGV